MKAVGENFNPNTLYQSLARAVVFIVRAQGSLYRSDYTCHASIISARVHASNELEREREMFLIQLF